eukprot:12685124-Prorocentrum_lima.AAC.1
MELLEDQHHLRLRQSTGQTHNKKILSRWIWTKNNHLWHILDNLMTWHPLIMKNNLLNFPIDRRSI